MNDWKVGGVQYLPVIAQLELKHNLTTDLLARVAYQECSLRPEVIDYSTPSAAGALGMFQLEPRDFPQVLQKRGWAADGEDAAAELARLYAHFHYWQLCIAAYNWGEGDVDRWLADGAVAALPRETNNYVRQVFADVPISGFIFGTSLNA